MTYHVGDYVRTPTGIVGRVDGFHGGAVCVSWGMPYTVAGERKHDTYAACHLAPATAEERRQVERENA